MKSKQVFKRKMMPITNLESLSLDCARKYFGSQVLNLKNAIGNRAKRCY